MGLKIWDATKHLLGAITGTERVPMQSAEIEIPKYFTFTDLKTWIFNNKINNLDKNKILTINNLGNNIDVKDSNGLINVDVNPVIEEMPAAITEINLDTLTGQSKIKIQNAWVTWLHTRIFKQGGIEGDVPIKTNGTNYNWSWSNLGNNLTFVKALLETIRTSNDSAIRNSIKEIVKDEVTRILEDPTLNTVYPAGSIMFLNKTYLELPHNTLVGWTELDDFDNTLVGIRNASIGVITGSDTLLQANLPTNSYTISVDGTLPNHAHLPGDLIMPNHSHKIPTYKSQVGAAPSGVARWDDRKDDVGGDYEELDGLEVTDWAIDRAITGDTGNPTTNPTITSTTSTFKINPAVSPTDLKVKRVNFRAFQKN